MRIYPALLLVVCACKSTPSLDPDFKLERDAFVFANFSDDSTNAALDADAMARLFGADAACADTASPCTLKPAAKLWMDFANTAIGAGRCEGFNLLSQLFFLKLIEAKKFGATTARALTPSAALKKELAYWAATQLVADGGTPQALSAKDAVARLKTALRAHDGKLYRIGMVSRQGGAAVGAHAVTPLGVASGASQNQVFIRVYDSNAPNAEQRIAVDLAANAWSYTLNDGSGASVSLSGDANDKNPLYVSASTPHLGTFACPFCGPSADGMTVLTAGVTITSVKVEGAAPPEQAPIFLQPFSLQPASPSAGSLSPGLYLQVLDGMIHLTNNGGSANFAAGQFGYVSSRTQPPVILPANPGLKFTPPPSFNQPMTASFDAKSAAMAIDCQVARDSVTRDTTAGPGCGLTSVKKSYCARRDLAVTPAVMSITRAATTNAAATTVSVSAGALGVGLDTSDSAKPKACATSSSAVKVDVSVSPTPSTTFTGTATVSGDAAVTLETAAWAGPGQPMTATVTQDGVDTTVQIADTHTPDTIAPVVGTPLVANVTGFGRVSLSWGAAIDADNTATPAPPLTYKVVSASAAAALATVDGADAAHVVMPEAPSVTSFNVTNLPPATTSWFAVVVKDLSGNRALYPAVSATTDAAKLVFQIPTNAATANLGGIAGADALCNAASVKPVNRTFKALLVDGATRVACTSANCASGGASEHVDWVFTPETPYENTDARPTSTPIMTDAKGLLVYPLGEPLSLNDVSFWTGLASGWVTGDNCAGWTSPQGSDTGAWGYVSQTSAGSYSTGASGCDSGRAVVCVEQ